MFGHFVNRMLLGGGGDSGGGGGGGGLGDGGGRAANQGGMGGSSSSGGSRGGGGGGPGRDTPGSPNASDGRRGSSMGAGGGSAGVSGGSPGRDTPGAPDADDGRRGASMGAGGGSAGSSRGGSTNPGRPGGESNERSMRVGSESISGSGSARSSFSFNARNSAPAMSTFRDSRSAVSPSTQGTFRAAREVTRDRTPMSSVINQDALNALESIDRVGGPRTASDRARMRAYSSVQPSYRDRLSEQGLGIIEGNQPEMSTGFLGPVLGGAFALGQNALAGRKTANELTELEKAANLPENFFPEDPSTFSRAYSAERLANVPVFGALTGGDRANEQALIGQAPSSEPNVSGADAGGGGGEPYSPPQSQTIPQPQTPPVRPPQPQDQDQFGIGRLRNYNSYARRFFNAT